MSRKHCHRFTSFFIYLSEFPRAIENYICLRPRAIVLYRNCIVTVCMHIYEQVLLWSRWIYPPRHSQTGSFSDKSLRCKCTKKLQRCSSYRTNDYYRCFMVTQLYFIIRPMECLRYCTALCLDWVRRNIFIIQNWAIGHWEHSRSIPQSIHQFIIETSFEAG